MAASEEQVILGFHALLAECLAQARAEQLLSDEDLNGQNSDIEISGPALVLYFAALGSPSTVDPAITAPDGSFQLSSRTCPPSLLRYFQTWQQTVAPIQALNSEKRHDLALLLCDKEPESSPLDYEIVRLSHDLKSVSIEIAQRRTFQLRLQADLQSALDAPVRVESPHAGAENRRAASYAAPPEYANDDAAEFEEKELKKVQGFASAVPASVPSANGSISAEQSLAIIRETLYSALADVLVETPSIRSMLARGPSWASRAHYASICLAILSVCQSRVSSAGVRTVQLGAEPILLTPGAVPPHLRPLLGGLMAISDDARKLSDRDDEQAIQAVVAGGEPPERSMMDGLKEALVEGMSEVDEQVRPLANAVNRVALRMGSLPGFKERQSEAFKVLAHVTST